MSFRPDHTSELYADTMRIIMVSNEKNSRQIQLSGKSRASNMYVRGVEHLGDDGGGGGGSESMILADVWSAGGEGGGAALVDEKEETKTKSKTDPKHAAGAKSDLHLPIPILVTLYSMPSHKVPGEFAQAEKVIFVGCMRVSSDRKDVKKVIFVTPCFNQSITPKTYFS